jgi:PAS domain S-box-containing protein
MNTLNSSTDPLILIKANRLLDCNQAAVELFGYKQKEDLLTRIPQELLAEQQADGVSAPQKLLYLWEQVLEDGLHKEVIICRNRSGNSFVVDFQAISQQMEGGGILFYTKWLVKKELLPNISPISPMLSEISTDIIAVLLHIDKNGNVLYANREARGWLGRSAEALSVSCNLSDLLIPVAISSGGETSNRKLPRWLAESNDIEKEILLTFQHEQGHELPARARIQLMPAEQEGDEVFWQLDIQPFQLPERQEPLVENLKLELAGLTQENKNLKRLQKVLKKSLERFRMLAEYSPDVIIQFDRAYRHLFVNSQIEKHYHFKVAEYLGKTHAEIGFPAEFCRNCEEVLEAVFTSGKSKRTELHYPNGIWVDWFLIPEFNARGEVNTVITTGRNITEQKKTQLMLEKSERRLNDAFEVTKLSSWEYNLKSDDFFLGKNLKKLLGIEDEAITSVKGRDYLAHFVVKEDHGKFRFIIEAALASRQEDFQEIIDYRITKPDGELVHILASVRLELADEATKVKSLYGTIQDITQLRLTEQELEEYRTSLERLVETRTQELKKSEAKLSDALRLANLGGWEYDPVLDCFIMSNEALEIIGTTAEIEGGNVLTTSRSKEVIHPDDFELYRKAVYRAREMEDEFHTEHAEFRIVRSDGDIRYIYLSIKTSKAGLRIKFYGTLQDITDMRRTEWEKNRLNAIIETTSDIVGIVQADGGINYLNKAGKDFFGIKSDEDLENRSFSDFQSHRAEPKPSRRDLYQADSQGIWSAENQYLRHDGVEVPVSQVIISHKTPDGRVECYSTIIRDMSQQKRIEQDLIFKNNELDTFVYRASHDLRGPIATLMGLQNLVHYEIKNEKALDFFEMYNSQVQRLNTITLTLIELTKIKEREFKPSCIDFKKIVRTVYRQVQHMTESQDMLLEQDLDVIQDFVSDERLLNMILQNLVENSVKYKRHDTDSFVRVEVKQKEETGRIVIKVSDNGIGIDSGIQGKIFNMFFRGNERSGGSGLGLYMLKNAVEKLGGRVTLYSVLYKGTTFKIELPSLTTGAKKKA